MEISYTHVQKRKHLGKKCRFSNVGPHLTVDIDRDLDLQSQYIERTAKDKETQLSRCMSQHEVNTLSLSTNSTGMNHVVGGWPADVDPRYSEQVKRFNKKILKDESFLASMTTMEESLDMFIKENNSLDIYEEYFSAESQHENGKHKQFKTLGAYRDCCDVRRKVLDLSWSLDGGKIAAVYSASEIVDRKNFCRDCYVWDLGDCNVPFCTLETSSSLRVLEHSPRDLEILLGGCSNGQIGLWDARGGGRAYQLTPLISSHKECVSGIKWIISKTGTEFLSTSTDGELFCWDCRNMSKANLEVSLEKQSCSSFSCNGITCLEYETCLPHRFMMGTVEGLTLSCNRKYNDPAEMISASYDSRNGPVLGIQRNPFFPKFFLSFSSWSVKIWTEDITSSPVLNLVPDSGYVTDTVWCYSHPSFLLLTKSTGHIEVWDILLTSQSPLQSFKLETEGLSRLKHKQNSSQVACGTPNGCIHLIELPEYPTFPLKREKNLLSAMLDREGKREKLLDGMMKEQALRQSRLQLDVTLKVDQKFNSCIPQVTYELAMENMYEKEINLEVVTAEFNSDYDTYVLGDDGEMDENADDSSFCDSQYEETLSSISSST